MSTEELEEATGLMEAQGAGSEYTWLDGEVQAAYEVEDLIGHGAHAMVYRARDRRTGEVAAIKHFTLKTGDKRRFFNEVKLTLRFNHPHIVRCLGLFGAERTSADLVFEYADGGNLRNVLEETGALGVERSLEVMRQLASAMAHAHGASVLHRDLKPENILVFKAGHPAPVYKVADFGISKVLQPQAGTYTSMGSPFYMAPEQFYERYDLKSDIYALGVIWYEMLHGRVPFEGSVAAVFKAHAGDPPVLSQDLPEAVSRLLLSTLAKDPEARPPAPLLAESLRAIGGTRATPVPAGRTFLKQAQPKASLTTDDVFADFFGGGPENSSSRDNIRKSGEHQRVAEVKPPPEPPQDAAADEPLELPPLVLKLGPGSESPARTSGTGMDAKDLADAFSALGGDAAVYTPSPIDTHGAVTVGRVRVTPSWTRVVETRTEGIVNLDDGGPLLCLATDGIRELQFEGIKGRTLIEQAMSFYGVPTTGCLPMSRGGEIVLLRDRAALPMNLKIKAEVTGLAANADASRIVAATQSTVCCHNGEGLHQWTAHLGGKGIGVFVCYDQAGRLMLLQLGDDNHEVHFLDDDGATVATHWLPGVPIVAARSRDHAGAWVVVLRRKGPELIRVGVEGISLNCPINVRPNRLVGGSNWLAGRDEEGGLVIIDPASGSSAAVPVKGDVLDIERGLDESELLVLTRRERVMRYVSSFKMDAAL